MKKRKKKNKNTKAFISGVSCMVILYTIGHLGYKSYKSFVDDIGTVNYQYKYIMNTDDYEKIITKLENEFSVNIPDDKKDELLMLNAIYENKNLTEDEKNVFYGFYSIVDDIQDMDRCRAYNALEDVKIIRTKNEESDSSILGDYSYGPNIINIYSEDTSNKVLVHEGIHCMFNSEITEKLPRYFNEGVTELLANEYFSEDPFIESNSYPIEISYVKMLCELVGSDNVIKTFTSGDMNYILEEMDKYNDSGISSKTILDIYEDAYNVLEMKVEARYIQENRTLAQNALLSIYKNKNYDGNINFFNYNLELASSAFKENPTKYYADFVSFYGVLEKAYFSEDLKLNFREPKIVNITKRHTVKVKSRLSVNLTK